jgi:hypothetical protein
MNTHDSHPGCEVTGLAHLAPVPAERDLPGGRQQIIKEHLMTEIRTEHHPAPSPEKRRRPRRTTLAAAGASLVAAAAVTASVVSLPGHAGSSVAHQGGGHMTATQLLAKVADAAGRAPSMIVHHNQYSYIDSQVSFSTGDRPAPVRSHRRQVWIPAFNLCRITLLIENGRVSRDSDKVGRTPYKPSYGGWQPVPPSHCPILGSLNEPTFESLKSLPTDPQTLLNLIEQGRGPSPDQEAFTTIGDLLRESLPPPAVSAALYRAAALIPGVTLVPDAVDAAGRHGVAVSFTFGDTQEEWIFNKDTFAYLGEKDFTHGVLDGKTAVLNRAIVDKAGQIPPSQG